MAVRDDRGDVKQTTTGFRDPRHHICQKQIPIPKNVEILWASVREPYNYLQAKQLGCQIITAPPSIIGKIEKFGKSFNQLSLETVKGFLNDSKKSKFKI